MRILILLALLGSLPPQVANAASPGEIWTEPKTGMIFVWVPKGCFKMGTDTLTHPDGLPRLFNNPRPHEMPRHEVCLEGFWLGRHEVTQKEWRMVTGSNPSDAPGYDNRPVEMVNWDEAMNFAKLFGEYAHLKDTFRLPTEAEWEYACRSGGKGDEIYAGSNSGNDEDFSDYAWLNPTVPENRTFDVGSKKPNGLGLYDMSGNVWEWVQDSYAEKGYEKHKLHQPMVEIPGERRKVIRGSSYRGFPPDARCAGRNWDNRDDRLHNLGLRLVRIEAAPSKNKGAKP